MKTSPLLAALPLLFAFSVSALAQTETVTLPRPSPRASVSQTIGITDVTVVYGRPSVNKREIWGKLEPWGYVNRGFGTSQKAPWRAGANENTTISFPRAIKVGDQTVPGGTYGLFMALTPEGKVTVILSKDNNHWGSFYYDESRDAARVDVQWEDAPFHEQLTYEFTNVTDDSAVLALLWEKKRIPIPIKVDTVAQTVASLKDEMRSSRAFHYQAGVDASQYLVAHDVELPLALQWAEWAVNDRFFGERNFNTLSNQAATLVKLGREPDAKPVMDEALKYGTALQVHQYGRLLLSQGKKARALEVFRLNAQLHPNVWPVNYGLARGLSANGDYPAALAALLQAQKDMPAGDALNANAIATNIEKLKRGEDIN
jgi:tetratricopeptide (TPR) repeat protein